MSFSNHFGGRSARGFRGWGLASLFVVLLSSCSPHPQSCQLLSDVAPITPDYRDVTLPPNLAPIRFSIEGEQLSQQQAVFEAGSQQIVVAADDGEVAITPSQWKALINEGSTVRVRIQASADGEWIEYQPFDLYISPDPIDSHLAYRLIEPGYEVWGEMGLYQRDLESYDERAIITNQQTNGGCMNCHSFNQRDPEQMLFHLRQELGGTYVAIRGQVEKLNTKTPQTISALVYPYWHPSGRYVAFSTNDTQQASHSTDPNRIEVFDNRSDLVVYDVERHEIFSSPLLMSADAFETFPTFSPDGSRLYFTSADSVHVKSAYLDVHYSLCAIDFDATQGTFGQQVDTLYNARTEGGSVSFPRISPDGRYLVYTRHGYGNFSIWHHDADLWLIDLLSGQHRPLTEANSDDVDSYHSWSSNSRWLVFSSRRIDGLYTRPYVTHIDADGQCTKPVLLPQRDVHYYDRLMKSYNIPELVDGPITVTPQQLEHVARTSQGIDLQFVEH